MCFTTDGLSLLFPEILCIVMYETVSDDLANKKCVCEVGSPNFDWGTQTNTNGSCTDFPPSDTDGVELFYHIVTRDETWISQNTPGTKCQSIEWYHSRSSSKPKKIKQILSIIKVMATIFWDRKGVPLIHYMTREETISTVAYCRTLHWLRQAIQNRQCELLFCGDVLLLLI